MMLKQATPSRSLKTRGFKVKHALQICLLLAISIWLLYQVKQRSHFNNNISDPFPNLTDKIRQGNPMIKFGRKDLNPVLRDHDFESSKEEETEIDDTKVEEINAMEGRGGGDDEIDGNDQERAEQDEEEDEDSDSELEDLIDEEDREKEEVTEETVEGSQTKERVNDDVLTSLKNVKEEYVTFTGKKSIKIHDSITRDAYSSERV